MAKKKKSVFRSEEIFSENPDIVSEKPSKFSEQEALIKQQPKKINWLGFVIVGGLVLCLLLAGISLAAFSYISRFEKGAEVPAVDVLHQIRQGMQSDPFSSSGRVSIMLLGLDELQNRTGEMVLTDTIMLLVVERDGSISMISIPRDLWIEAYTSKINALYAVGETEGEGEGIEILKRTLSEITGLPIDYYIILKLETVKEVIDVMGGVTVKVERSFVDKEYPRDDVDPSSGNPEELYETISFEQGVHTFDGSTTLQFLRSRQSEDIIEGTDLARNRRQQVVMEALLDQLHSSNLAYNPYLLGRLYRIWHSDVDTSLTDVTVIGISKSLVSQSIQINPVGFSVADDEQDGVIKANPKNRFNQWVFEPVDPSWQQIQEFIRTSLDK